MRFIITAQPDPNSTKKVDPNAPFDEKLFKAYMKFNEDMYKAGVLLAAEGLAPQGKGAQIGVKDNKRVLLDGPYAETKELVGGFYLIEVDSFEEAVEWAKRCPSGLGFDDLLSIHQMTDESDLPPELVQLIREAAPTWSASWSKK